MNYARRKEILARARAAYPAPLCHSPWFQPARKRVKTLHPTKSAAIDLIFASATLKAVCAMHDASEAPPFGVDGARAIREAVAFYFGMEPAAITGRCTQNNTRYARRLSFYLTWKHVGSISEAARLVGYKFDTVKRAATVVRRALEEGDRRYSADIEALSCLLRIRTSGKRRGDPTQAEVRETFDYSPEDGKLRWRVTARGKRAGAIAGRRKTGDRTDGWSIEWGSRKWEANRLVWIYHHGDIPPTRRVRAIDGKRWNSALENLELVETFA